MGNAVFYVDMERPERGKYTCTFRLLTADAASLPEHEMTKRFFAMLEQTVRRDPRFYLWTLNKVKNQE